MHGPARQQEQSEADGSEARTAQQAKRFQGSHQRRRTSPVLSEKPVQVPPAPCHPAGCRQILEREGQRSRTPSLADVPVWPGAHGGRQGTLLRNASVLTTWEGISSWAFG